MRIGGRVEFTQDTRLVGIREVVRAGSLGFVRYLDEHTLEVEVEGEVWCFDPECPTIRAEEVIKPREFKGGAGLGLSDFADLLYGSTTGKVEEPLDKGARKG